MHEYISLLRGINVGGKTLKMDRLASLYESLGLRDVTTYIQSGNVLFNTAHADMGGLKATIENQIRDQFGLSVTVIIKDRRELAEIIERNPFVQMGRAEVDKMHVTFLEGKPEEAWLERLPLDAGMGDEFRVIGTEVYLLCPGGYGRTVLSNSFFEKNLQVRATTRNWRTVNKLYQIATGGDD